MEMGWTENYSIGQVSSLVLYQASLPPPVRVSYSSEKDRSIAKHGEVLFSEIGCASCHIPRLPLRSAWFLEPNPYNRPGSAIPRDVVGQIALPFPTITETGIYRNDNGMVFVAAYTDLKRHVICDEEDPFFCNERVLQDFVPTSQFLTAKLWDAGTSSPYGHRGDLTTISEAIAHHSGEAKASKMRYVALSDDDRAAIRLFLKSLQVDEKAH